MPRHKVEEPWARWSNMPSPQGGPKVDQDTLITVFCSYVDFDGAQFGPVSVTFTILPYGGSKDVRSLPIYPLKFAKDSNLRDNLIKRGRMLLDVSKYKSM